MNLVLVSNERFLLSAVNLIESYKKHSANQKIIFTYFGKVTLEDLAPIRDYYGDQIVFHPVPHTCDHAHDPAFFFYKVFSLFKAMEYDEPFLYLDCGAEILRPTDKVESMLREKSRFFVWVDHVNRNWTTRRCFEIMGLTEERYKDALHYWGGCQAYLPTAENKAFIKEMFEWIHNPEIAGPDGDLWFPEAGNPECIKHRNDQSLLSLLIERNGWHQNVRNGYFLYKYGGWTGPNMVPDQVIYSHRFKDRSVYIPKKFLAALVLRYLRKGWLDPRRFVYHYLRGPRLRETL